MKGRTDTATYETDVKETDCWVLRAFAGRVWKKFAMNATSSASISSHVARLECAIPEKAPPLLLGCGKTHMSENIWLLYSWFCLSFCMGIGFTTNKNGQTCSFSTACLLFLPNYRVSSPSSASMPYRHGGPPSAECGDGEVGFLGRGQNSGKTTLERFWLSRPRCPFVPSEVGDEGGSASSDARFYLA